MSMMFCSVDSSWRKAFLNASVSSATPSPRAPNSLTLTGTDCATEAPAPEAVGALAAPPPTPTKLAPNRKTYKIKYNETNRRGNDELTPVTFCPLMGCFTFWYLITLLSAAKTEAGY